MYFGNVHNGELPARGEATWCSVVGGLGHNAGKRRGRHGVNSWCTARGTMV